MIWLRKRHIKTANIKYLKSDDQVEQEEDINDCFQKIDLDNSGTLDVQELHQALNENGLKISKAEINEFFNLCKTQCKGYLTMNEFNDLYKNPKADELFRFYVKRARKIN